MVNSLLTQYFPTLILFLFNFVLIPLLIDLIAIFESHRTKSGRQLSIMKKNFVFMMLNAIFLPLTELATIKAFISYLAEIKFEDLPTALSQNLVASYYFFLRYMI